jgi:hypothetical protein
MGMRVRGSEVPLPDQEAASNENSPTVTDTVLKSGISWRGCSGPRAGGEMRYN